jgi:hypothetical protein
VLERVSAGTRAVSVYWNADGETRFSYATAGRVLVSFDVGFPPVPEWLDGELDVSPLEPLAAAVRPEVCPDIEPLTYEDPPLVAVENHERLGPFAHYANLPSATVTITWSARGRALLHYSQERRLLALLDPQDPGQLSGADPAVLDAHLGGVRLGPTGVGAAACLPSLLVLAERLAGIAFDPVMLDRPHMLVPRPSHLNQGPADEPASAPRGSGGRRLSS